MIPSMMTGCKKESTSYSHTDFAMGTVTNITLYGTSDDLEGTEQKIIDMEKKLEKQQLSWRLKSSRKKHGRSNDRSINKTLGF